MKKLTEEQKKQFEPIHNEDETVTLKLRFPIEGHGRKVTQVTVQLAEHRDMKHLDASANVDEVGKIAARLCGLAEDEFDKLKSWDSIRIIAVVNSFFGDGLEIGES